MFVVNWQLSTHIKHTKPPYKPLSQSSILNTKTKPKRKGNYLNLISTPTLGMNQNFNHETLGRNMGCMSACLSVCMYVCTHVQYVQYVQCVFWIKHGYIMGYNLEYTIGIHRISHGIGRAWKPFQSLCSSSTARCTSSLGGARICIAASPESSCCRASAKLLLGGAMVSHGTSVAEILENWRWQVKWGNMREYKYDEVQHEVQHDQTITQQEGGTMQDGLGSLDVQSTWSSIPRRCPHVRVPPMEDVHFAILQPTSHVFFNILQPISSSLFHIFLINLSLVDSTWFKHIQAPSRHRCSPAACCCGALVCSAPAAGRWLPGKISWCAGMGWSTAFWDVIWVHSGENFRIGLLAYGRTPETKLQSQFFKIRSILAQYISTKPPKNRITRSQRAWPSLDSRHTGHLTASPRCEVTSVTSGSFLVKMFRLISG